MSSSLSGLHNGSAGTHEAYTYLSNTIDLLTARQTTGGSNDLLATLTSYTTQHQPQSVTDAADRFPSYGDAKMALFDYIEVFYNQRRRHSTLGQISPAAFERTTAA